MQPPARDNALRQFSRSPLLIARYGPFFILLLVLLYTIGQILREPNEQPRPGRCGPLELHGFEEEYVQCETFTRPRTLPENVATDLKKAERFVVVTPTLPAATSPDSRMDLEIAS